MCMKIGKHIILAAVFALFCFAVTACSFIFSDDTVTINGTVTLTRNDIPWNTANFPEYKYAINTEDAFFRAVPPPQNPYFFTIYAYLESDMREYIASAWADYSQIPADLANGTYKWRMQIPSDTLPGSIYFKVICNGSSYNYSTSHVSYRLDTIEPSKVSEGILVLDGNETIDIGIIDFKILQLSGNLPVTVNGEALDYKEYQLALLEIFYPFPYGDKSRIYISPEGDWSFYAFVPDTLESLQFQIWARKNDGIFRQILNPDSVITVLDTEHETEKKVFFLSYPSIDFKAFNISGTIEFISQEPKESPSSHHIWFFDNMGIQIADIDKRRLEPADNGLFYWKTMMQAFSFPCSLPYKVPDEIIGYAYYYDYITVTPSSAVITITDGTDLDNIYLGSFIVKSQRINY